MTERQAHPAAELFPLLEGAEFEALVADVKVNGLREAIWLDTEDRILDGRNRYRACDEVGVEPRFRTYEGDDPVGFVLSQNLHRRHLNESQRAMIAAQMADMPQGARTDLSPEGGRLSQADAAALRGVGKRTVERAKIVLTQGGGGAGARRQAGPLHGGRRHLRRAPAAGRPVGFHARLRERSDGDGRPRDP